MSELDLSLTNSQIFDIVEKGGGRVHFIGVGGVSMCSIFCLCRHFGIAVSGSDRKSNLLIDSLISAGECVYVGEKEEVPADTSLVVYSHAIPFSHPERVCARRRGIPEIDRAKYLGALMRCYDRRIGVSGSHGKSTVTAMISKILTDAGLSPTVLSGASLFNSRLPFSIGSFDYLVYEACEYKDSFLNFHPTLSVFLNLELDHTDYFKDIDALSASFLSAMKNSPRVIVNLDDERLLDLARLSGSEVVTFGLSADADYRYEIISKKPKSLSFKLYRNSKEEGVVTLPMRGCFNIGNAVAAIAAAMESSVDFCEAVNSLSSFSGIERRLEEIGEYKGRRLFYDYAHHPSEIKASVGAIKDMGGCVSVIFRPHTYSRTAGLFRDFVASLKSADHVIVLDIDAVREEKREDISSKILAEQVGAVYCEGEKALIKALDNTEGDIILMGAADVEGIKKLLTNRK